MNTQCNFVLNCAIKCCKIKILQHKMLLIGEYTARNILIQGGTDRHSANTQLSKSSCPTVIHTIPTVIHTLYTDIHTRSTHPIYTHDHAAGPIQYTQSIHYRPHIHAAGPSHSRALCRIVLRKFGSCVAKSITTPSNHPNRYGLPCWLSIVIKWSYVFCCCLVNCIVYLLRDIYCSMKKKSPLVYLIWLVSAVLILLSTLQSNQMP